MMNKYVTTILLLLLISRNSGAQVVDSNEVFQSLFKCWRSVSHEYSLIYGLEEEEIKVLAKQKICFSRDSMSTYEGDAYTPLYHIRKVNAENYAKENFDCAKVKLGIIKDTVYEITISCYTKPNKSGDIHQKTEIIAYDGYFLYIVKDGVIFKMIDYNFKASARGAN
jgi:hypothetical protein